MTTAKKTGDEARRLSDLSEDIGIRFQYPNSDRVYIPAAAPTSACLCAKSVRTTPTRRKVRKLIHQFQCTTPAAHMAIRRRTSI